jgi:hypothetical protein
VFGTLKLLAEARGTQTHIKASDATLVDVDIY